MPENEAGKMLLEKEPDEKEFDNDDGTEEAEKEEGGARR